MRNDGLRQRGKTNKAMNGFYCNRSKTALGFPIRRLGCGWVLALW
jgi:hypothetical protein